MDKEAIIQALRSGGGNVQNFLQSMSNGVADGTVGGAVDMVNSGLDTIGVPTVDAPVMGSKWLKQKGFMPDTQPGVGQVAGEGLGLAMGGAALSPAQLSTLLKSGVNRYMK